MGVSKHGELDRWKEPLSLEYSKGGKMVEEVGHRTFSARIRQFKIDKNIFWFIKQTAFSQLSETSMVKCFMLSYPKNTLFF